MKWTLRRAAALVAAACLTAISAAAIPGRHHWRRIKPVHHAPVHKTNKQPHAAARPAHRAAAHETRPLPAIDRAAHGREPLDSGYYSPSISRGESIARTALAYRGVAYRFGGRSARSGFDCSGLVQVVCAKWGIYLPRVAGAQFYHGAAVRPAELEAGDLVFFKGTYKRGLSHVGIYVGQGQFVHAAGRRKGVRISNLGDAYFQHHWAGARRLDLNRLPRTHDETPVVASEVIVDHPGEYSELRERDANPDRRAASQALADWERNGVEDTGPPLR